MTGGPWGVYVHVPWCRVRCPYCAFYVEPDRGDVPWQPFVDAVLRERDLRLHDFVGRPHTVYLGGGTPSRLPPEALMRLIGGLDPADAVEVTAEANPEDLTPAWLDAALAAGVDRISLGVQTLHPHHARRLGRAHTPDEARAAMALLGQAPVRSWSADLMFALHAQSVDELRADLDALLAFEPPHVSVYGLTIEPGTAYERAVDRGTLSPADEELWRSLYGLLVDELGKAGLQRYEVSNFARPGHRARHNEGYWQDRPYLGLGPAAHGLTPDGTRWSNVADVTRYLDLADPTEHRERPTGEERALDLLVSGLRSVEGLSLDHLARASGHLPSTEVRRQLTSSGHLREVDGRMMLAPEGFYVADGVVRTLAQHLRPIPRSAGPRPDDPLEHLPS
jgi:oxygen-independent coproporphyrinogen-3 oxidase